MQWDVYTNGNDFCCDGENKLSQLCTTSEMRRAKVSYFTSCNLISFFYFPVQFFLLVIGPGAAYRQEVFFIVLL